MTNFSFWIKEDLWDLSKIPKNMVSIFVHVYFDAFIVIVGFHLSFLSTAPALTDA